MTIESECPVWLRYIDCSKKNIKGLGQIFLRELSGFRAAGPAQNSPLGPRLVIPLGPRSVQPARFAQAGPVWFPRTKTGGAPPGFPCGSRFPPGAGPTRDPSACVGWVASLSIMLFLSQRLHNEINVFWLVSRAIV